jgi:hypothetical protein
MTYVEAFAETLVTISWRESLQPAYVEDQVGAMGEIEDTGNSS